MEEALIEFKKNYSSLISKIDTEEISDRDYEALVSFCALLRSDDLELYNEYKSKYRNLTDDFLIYFFAKRYNLDPEKQLADILRKIINNGINDGVCYHMGSSANYESIMTDGLNTDCVGVLTEESEDYKQLCEMIPRNRLKYVFPFNADKKEPTLYYSNKPVVNTRYGNGPEWLQELKLNFNTSEMTLAERDLAREILSKYKIKYDGAHKVLYVLPGLAKKIPEEAIEQMTSLPNIDMVISSIGAVLERNNESEKVYLSPGHFLALDLDSLDLSYTDDYGEIVNINNNKIY